MNSTAVQRLAILLLIFASACRDSAQRDDFDVTLVRGEVKIAFIADQGYEPANRAEGPRAVLELIKNEGADAVMHQGDFDYNDDPAAWEEMINAVLGEEFPYFVSVGNHDVDRWHGPDGYRAVMEQRMQRIGLTWDGELGEMASIRFKDVLLLFGAPGTLGVEPDTYADYFRDQLAADDSIWSVCGWHKNQRDMQVGGKSDETGWRVYEECRAGGAIIATGHEHSYSRTHLLSNIEQKTVASTSDTLVLTPGESFAFVSGLGGQSIRRQVLDGDWWAAIYTATQGANHGALFGVFRTEQPNHAFFYFKDIDGVVADRFQVISNVQ